VVVVVVVVACIARNMLERHEPCIKLAYKFIYQLLENVQIREIIPTVVTVSTT
jgi:hypothetical protein